MSIDFGAETPTTLDEAITRIVNSLTEDEKVFIRKNGATSTHHGIGTQLRNRWGLWTGSVLKEHFKTAFGLGHADDMSGLILYGVDAAVNGAKYDPMPIVERFKDHWVRMNVDPLTMHALKHDEKPIDTVGHIIP